MMGIVIALHIIVCVLLITIILIQAGRGGGLVEGFSSVESMFGPKTNTFLTRTTTTLSILFFVTCLSLAFLSARQSRSLMRQIKPQEAEAQQPAQQQQLPQPEAQKQEATSAPEPPKTE